MRRSLALLALLLLVSVRAVAQPLPQDPRFVDGELENGIRYLVMRHATPPGRAAMWLHIRTGSLNESDRQRGLAHFLEHMAFNGTEHFPPGEVVRFFERMGMKFGADLNAHTGFDQTVYKLRLPDTESATIAEGLRFLADVAFRMDLLEDEIEKERGIILEEKRGNKGAQQRILDYIFENLAPGSLFGQRLPIGTEERILGATREDFAAYYRAWYTPERMVLIVVADADPEPIIGAIRAELDIPVDRREHPDQDPMISPSREARALVASDRELTRCEVSLVRIDEPVPPTTDEATARARIVEAVAMAAFNRRMSARVQRGEASFQSASASIDSAFGVMRMLWAQASGEPDRWGPMLDELAAEIQRVRAHGFGELEIDDVRRELIADAERAVEVESTRDAWTILASTSSRVAEREALTSAAQRLDLLRRSVATLTAKDASAAFAHLADIGAATVIVTLPSGEAVPTTEEVLSRARSAMANIPGPLEERARATGILAELPGPGEVVEEAVHEASGVYSAWLSNGVRVHHRFMDYEKDDASIVVTLAGGEILEDASNRGISQAAGLAWQRQATMELSSTDVRDLMTGYKVGVGGRTGQDTMTLSIGGNPAELERGMQLAHALLTRPRIEEAGFTQWKERVRQGLSARDKDPRYALGTALYDTILPAHEVRVRELTGPQLDAITLEAAQAWLEMMISRAPIEVAIVGDIAREDAMALAKRYLGSLPARERISPATCDEFRTVTPPPGPLAGLREIETETPMAFVVSGCLGVEAASYREERLLAVASQVLSTRMVEALREQEQLVYSISAGVSPGAIYPGLGTITSFAPTDPGKSDALAARLREHFASFAESGPTEEEAEVAKKQSATAWSEQVLKPGFWTGLLATMEYRDRDLDEILRAEALIAGFTPAEMRDAFARHYRDAARFEVIVRPKITP